MAKLYLQKNKPLFTKHPGCFRDKYVTYLLNVN